MTLLTPVYLALRPPEPRPELTPEDEERLRALMERHRDSLAYFNLRRDKSVVWSPTGKAAIAYRVVSGVMLASGDPIGDPEAWPGAIRAFLETADAHAWTPAVLGCSEKAGTVWVRETGFAALELGDEAVVDATAFTLEGRHMRNVRQMVSRIERAGYVVEVSRVGEVDEGVRKRALVDAAAWRSSDTERGFSMALGRLLDKGDADCVFVAARQDGVVRAFLQFVPWGQDGMSLDVMRRDSEADGGGQRAAHRGGPARSAQPGDQAGLAELRRLPLCPRAQRAPRRRADRACLGAGAAVRLPLAADREPLPLQRQVPAAVATRFLVYPTAADLPRVGLAGLEAEAFLTWPRLGRLGGAR